MPDRRFATMKLHSAGVRFSGNRPFQTERTSSYHQRPLRTGQNAKSRIGAILRETSGNFLGHFGVFWLGALMRSVGAIVLGAYIDQIGRRQGPMIAPAIMAVSTIIIAFFPAMRRSALPHP